MTSSIDKVGASSSSVIVSVPVASLMVALLAFDNVSVAVSDASDNVTVKVAFPAEPDSVYYTSLIDNDVISSSTIVSVAVASLMVALLAFDNVSVAVSLTSDSVSTSIGTLNV